MDDERGDARNGTRYSVIPSQGVDVAVCVSCIPEWASTHKEHMDEV